MKPIANALDIIFSCTLFLLSFQVNAWTFPRRDPTTPVTYTEGSSKNEKVGYDLQSIIIGRTRPLALVNDKFVTIGDMIDNAKVIAINRNSVILEDSTQRITLYLFDRSIQE